ncbi:MAG TPA: (2Fe-2S)-binding protein [Microvirga sp.]|jgi:bacterioferritin-associated ferredoxin
MIVCSCNVLSDRDVKACLLPGPGCPRTPAQVYRCLGCSPNCGRCASTIRAIMDEALSSGASIKAEACSRGCCPVGLASPAEAVPHSVDELAVA